MQESARAFLAGLVDYAGLFPPAALDLGTTVRNYGAYRRGEQAWMLGRLIVPAPRLGELQPLRGDAEDASEAWPLAVLSAPPESWDALERAAIVTAGQVSEALKSQDGSIRPDLFEQRLPPGAAGRVAALESYARALDEHLSVETEVFFEGTFAPREKGATREVLAVVEALGELAARRSEGTGPFVRGGFKLRCGGVKAELYPDVEVVAAALEACHRAGVMLKATAGLHHPLRHFREDLGVFEHGFLNLFGAGVLLDVHDLDAKTLCDVVAEQQASAFAFDAEGFGWRDLRATVEQIVLARRRKVGSFGSCSFDEPREDLWSLGILKAAG